MNNPLSRSFNVAVEHITNQVLPKGFDISHFAPNDLDGLLSHFLATGRVIVWDGASDQTIFDCPETNFMFRAWHDSKHVNHNLPFDERGETQACLLQMDDIRALYDGSVAEYFCAILQAEIMSQFYYEKRHGGFPVDQMGFVRAVLGNASNPGSVPCPIWSGAPLYGISAPPLGQTLDVSV